MVFELKTYQVTYEIGFQPNHLNLTEELLQQGGERALGWLCYCSTFIRLWPEASNFFFEIQFPIYIKWWKYYRCVVKIVQNYESVKGPGTTRSSALYVYGSGFDPNAAKKKKKKIERCKIPYIYRYMMILLIDLK